LSDNIRLKADKVLSLCRAPFALCFQFIDRFSGFFPIIEVNAFGPQNLIGLMTFSGNQHRVARPGNRNCQLNGLLSIGFNDIAFPIEAVF